MSYDVSWLPITKSLPKMTDNILLRSDDFLISNGKTMMIGYLQFDYIDPDTEEPKWILQGRDAYRIDGIVAWVPLPNPPAQERPCI